MLVHNGKTYTPVNITPEMVGHKVSCLAHKAVADYMLKSYLSLLQLGEFAPTRKPFSYRQTKNR